MPGLTKVKKKKEKKVRLSRRDNILVINIHFIGYTFTKQMFLLGFCFKNKEKNLPFPPVCDLVSTAVYSDRFLDIIHLQYLRKFVGLLSVGCLVTPAD